ncbi:MAG: hypothetical protein P4L51_11055 [Puia sp.]|nr:hypothetical protein [Puia sp.]
MIWHVIANTSAVVLAFNSPNCEAALLQLKPRTLEFMDIKFAGSNENQSGQRFLDSSAPRLIRHVESCETAGGEDAPLVWDTYSLPAGKDQKPSWEFGGEAPDASALGAAGIVAAGGAAFSSLDSLTNNRNKRAERDYDRRPVGRGKYCGRMSITGFDPKTGRKKFRRINCGSWTCSYCGPRKARTARASIRRTAEGLGLRYFLTLTLDPSKLQELTDKKQAVRYLRETFNKFRLYLKRQYGEPPSYICVVEFTQRGIPHLHILFDRYISQKWISSAWDKLGGGRIVFIKQVTVNKIANYLSKYLTKELLLSAPKGTRRITSARSIKLFPKFDSGMVWELVKESIWSLLTAERMKNFHLQKNMLEFISLGFDEEKYLNQFELVNLNEFSNPTEAFNPCAV